MAGYFKPEEFECKCGECARGYEDMDNDLLLMLTTARVAAGIPFILNSAFRCRTHNRNEGGLDNSAHLLGKAVDIVAVTPFQRFHILKGLLWAGFNRLIIYPKQGFIHADVDDSKHQEIISIY